MKVEIKIEDIKDLAVCKNALTALWANYRILVETEGWANLPEVSAAFSRLIEQFDHLLANPPADHPEDEDVGDSGPVRYYAMSRPPGYATVPDPYGGSNSEVWYPARPVTGENAWMGQDRYFFGWVEYNFPLPFEQIRKYELWPADIVDWAKYQAWLEFGPDWVQEIKSYQAECDYAELQGREANNLDFISELCLILWDKL